LADCTGGNPFRGIAAAGHGLTDWRDRAGCMASGALRSGAATGRLGRMALHNGLCLRTGGLRSIAPPRNIREQNAMAKHRRSSFVDGTVQGRLVRRIFVHWLVFFGLLVVFLGLMSVLAGDPSQSVFERALAPASEYLLLGLLTLTLLPAFMLDTIRFSNRFVGPIARLRRSMRELAAGEPVKELRFRDDDLWTDAANEFNAVAHRIATLESALAAQANGKVPFPVVDCSAADTTVGAPA